MDDFARWQVQLHIGPTLSGTRGKSFLFMCVVWGISPSRRTLVCFAGGAPLILYVFMFPWKYFFHRKWERREEKKRRIVSIRGGSWTHVFSWGLRTPLGSSPRVPLPQENTLVWEPPLQLIDSWNHNLKPIVCIFSNNNMLRIKFDSCVYITSIIWKSRNLNPKGPFVPSFPTHTN